MLQPDYKEFSRLAREATLVPVVKSVAAIPRTARFRLSRNRRERAERLSAGVGRARRADRTLHVSGCAPLHAGDGPRGDDIVVQRGKRQEHRQGSAVQVIEGLLRQHRPATVPGLPPFTAGAVGYFAYDAVRQLENIGEHAKDDFSLPDCILMFFDRLLAFDHLRHQIHIIATADVSRESPRRAYDRAARDIAVLEKKLAAGLRPAHWQKAAGRAKAS